MAGSNLLLKENQVLFKEGDAADGMYLIRKGALNVYLEKDGNEVTLASIGPGGMIGEMAFFDKKPRSASVKAGSNQTEVTKITEQDFAKLMKQIPKWFVSIMTSLSTRLRETNERLQKLENQAAGAKSPYEDLIKIVHVLMLIWAKEGTKEGKNWCLNRSTAEKQIITIFGIDQKWVNAFFDSLIKEGILSKAADNYKNELLATQNKAIFHQLADFITEFLKHNPDAKSISDSALEMIETVMGLANEAAYDSCNIAFEDVVTEGERQSLNTSSWNKDLAFFKQPHDALGLVKVSSGVGFKVNKKEISRYVKYHRVLNVFNKAGLA